MFKAQAGDVAKVAADPALASYRNVGTQQVAELGLSGAPVGSQFAGGLTGVNVAGTGVDPSVFSSYGQAGDTTQAAFPGGNKQEVQCL